MIEVREREQLIQSIEQHLGRALAPHVRNAFLQVPRHVFVQEYYQQQGNSLNWDRVQATTAKIYQNEALVTQIDERGMPSSSTSQPSVMAIQLEALAVEPGQRILEIGVGTGYNAALLGTLVGDTGQVISIDIDEALAKRAKQHLVSANVHNVIALPGDGFLGEPTYAPYDCLLTTCSIRSIPVAWFDQLKIGGRLVGNWLTPLVSLFVCVEKTNSDELDGGLLNLSATYMEMHSRERVQRKQRTNWAQYDRYPSTSVPLPTLKTLLDNPAFLLLLQSFFPTMRKRYRSSNDQMHLYLLTQETAILVQDEESVIFGNAEIGSMIQQSLELYHHLGQPSITEYRVTFREHQAMICIGDQRFNLPLHFT